MLPLIGALLLVEIDKAWGSPPSFLLVDIRFPQEKLLTISNNIDCQA